MLPTRDAPVTAAAAYADHYPRARAPRGLYRGFKLGYGLEQSGLTRPPSGIRLGTQGHGFFRETTPWKGEHI